MSIQVSGPSDYLYTLTEPVSSYPFTLSGWIKAADITTTHTLVAIDTPDTAGYNILGVIDVCGACTSPADVPRAYCYDGSWGIANASTSYSAGSWVHVCGVFTSATSRSIFIDGGNKVTDTTSVSPTPSELIVCRRRRNNSQGHCNLGDYVAEIAVWDTALSDAEVAQLAAGIDPTNVDAGNLIAYWPFTTTTTNTDSIGSNDLTENQAITYSADHPGVGYEYADITGTITGGGSLSGDLTLDTITSLTGTISGTGALAGNVLLEDSEIFIISSNWQASTFAVTKRLVAVGNDSLYYEDI